MGGLQTTALVLVLLAGGLTILGLLLVFDSGLLQIAGVVLTILAAVVWIGCAFLVGRLRRPDRK